MSNDRADTQQPVKRKRRFRLVPARRRPVASAPATGYDRFVAFMRRALPAGVVLLLGGLVAYPFVNPRELSFIVSKDSVELSPERMRMEMPRYRGQDSKGQPFELTAQSAVQLSSASPLVELRHFSARIETSGGEASVRAERGQYDLDRKQLQTMGEVDMLLPDGGRVQTRNLAVDLNSRTMSGRDGVEGASPLGRISAQNIDVALNERTLVLTGNTRLRIIPERDGPRITPREPADDSASTDGQIANTASGGA